MEPFGNFFGFIFLDFSNKMPLDFWIFNERDFCECFLESIFAVDELAGLDSFLDIGD